ncbi:MAG TPA: glycosyl hydrolase family 28-related protein [Opitutus sp.]|nr:glycosyl hydrolase family 28-related protein [Opitutus sp.]
MKALRLASLLLVPLAGLAADFNVRDYGATGDGHVIDSPAIDHAIDAAAAAGGGTVVIPAGEYLCYSIHLRSHVALYLGIGATILAADPPPEGAPGGYDAPEPNAWEFYEDFGHAHWHNSLIWGENLEDISITGPGRIFGRGLSRGWHGTRIAAAPGETTDTTPPDAELDARSPLKPGPFGYPAGHDTLAAGVGNKAIALKNCRNVIFRDFTIFHGGHFAILATGVDNWTCDNLKIDTNRDGIDFDCCQNVHVSNCTVNSPFDDGICPKSSYALGYPRMTENITITNCQVSGFAEGTLLDGSRKLRADRHVGVGRIKCGTESNGGFRNITISNCVFDHCLGLALESVDGAQMEDIAISNLTMRDIGNAPIFIRLGGRRRGPDHPPIGTARRIKIDNVIAHAVAPSGGIFIAGSPGHAIEDVTLSNIFIDYAGGGTKAQAARKVPEMGGGYPEPDRWGALSSSALFARHAKNLNLHDVEFRFASPDLRPALVLDDVAGVAIDHLAVPRTAGTPAVRLHNVTAFDAVNSRGLPDTHLPGPIPGADL